MGTNVCCCICGTRKPDAPDGTDGMGCAITDLRCEVLKTGPMIRDSVRGPLSGCPPDPGSGRGTYYPRYESADTGSWVRDRVYVVRDARSRMRGVCNRFAVRFRWSPCHCLISMANHLTVRFSCPPLFQGLNPLAYLNVYYLNVYSYVQNSLPHHT